MNRPTDSFAWQDLERRLALSRDAGVGSGEPGACRCERCGAVLEAQRRDEGFMLCAICTGEQRPRAANEPDRALLSP